MRRPNFTVKVYDKGINLDKTWRITWVTAVPFLVVGLLSVIFFTNEELGKSVLFTIFFWCSFILLTVIQILSLVMENQRMEPLGVLRPLYVSETTIEYLNYSIPLASVVSVNLEIEEKEKSRFRGSNNLLQIRTVEREFNLGLVIESKDDLMNADKMADFLKAKKVPIAYERWVTLNI